MSKRSRTKPASPEAIQRRAAEQRIADFQAVGLSPSFSTAPANADVAVTREGQARATRKADHDAVMRLDAFSALKDTLTPGGYDAVRKFELLLATRKGEHDRGRSLSRVDCETGTDRTDAMIQAGERADQILRSMGMHTGWLLSELLSPSLTVTLSATTWRGVVAHVTGEQNPVAQAACVRMAVTELVKAYKEIEIGPRALATA